MKGYHQRRIIVLYRYEEQGIWFGVLYGIAQELDLDPAIVRILYCLMALATGLFFGILLYYILVACTKEDPHTEERCRALDSLR